MAYKLIFRTIFFIELSEYTSSNIYDQSFHTRHNRRIEFLDEALGMATIDSRFAKQILSSEMLSQYDQKRNVLNVDDGNDHDDNNECCDSYDIQ